MNILRKNISLGFMVVFMSSGVYAQDSNWGIRVSSYGLSNCGRSISVSGGYWMKFNSIQPALNISASFIGGRNHLGNNKNNNMQINIVMSPMLTLGWGRAFREEINTLYMSTASAVSSDYKTSFTLGSSFVTTPKGYGKNYLTARNRSQQLAFFQVKIGFDGLRDNKGENTILPDKTILPYTPNFKNDVSIQFNVVEDVGPEFLADKWDRYFTGGGSIQIRAFERFKAKVYSEVYTGTTPRDLMDFPDIAEDTMTFGRRRKDGSFIRRKENKDKNYRGFGPVRNARWAIQDASQKMFNSGITAFVLEIDQHTKGFMPNTSMSKNFNSFMLAHNIYLFKSGGGDMWQQNIIHTLSSPEIEKVLEDRDPERLRYKKIFQNKDLERLHFFKPNVNKSRPFCLGYGVNLYVN